MRLTQMYDDVSERGFQETAPGMAHWAGSGPTGTTCRECVYFTGKTYHSKAGGFRGGSKPAPCLKFKQLMRQKGPPVPHDSAACKYFALNELAPKAFMK